MIRQMEGVNMGERETAGRKNEYVASAERKMKLGADRVYTNREVKTSWGL